MARPEPWRKTGRKAKEDHWLGIDSLSILEISVYDDQGRQQGRALLQLSSRTIEDEAEEGQTWKGRLLAVEDGYYAWWVKHTYPYELLPFHFCGRQVHKCQVKTFFRDPIHVDVFRVLPEDSYKELTWLTDEHRNEINAKIEVKAVADPGPRGGDPRGSGEAEPRGGAVKPGEEGIRGLAEALGEHPRGAVEKEKIKQKRKAEEEPEREKASGSKALGLRGILSEREAPQPSGGALKISHGEKKKPDKEKKKKKKKKKDKGKKARKEKVDEESSSEEPEESSSSSSSSDESLFRLAALPQGVDRIHRIHEKRPGALANMTLKRCQELLERAVGRGAAQKETELPAVARAYLSQIYLNRHNEASIGLRNLRELRTLSTLIDYLAMNDPLRALDVAVQRVKSIELFVVQGQWNQASLLELILPEDEQRAWSREELKAAQQEHKADMKLVQDQWPKRRSNWSYGGNPREGGGPKKENEKGEEHPPENTGGNSKGKKGKGKGKKGKRW